MHSGFRLYLRDESGQILKHVITIGIGFAVVIFLLVEIGPIVLVRITSIQEAEDLAADAALQYYMNNSDEGKVRELVAEKMKLMNFSDDEIRDSAVQFLPEGSVPKTTARVTAVRYAKTLVSSHVNWLKKLERVTTTKEASIQQK
jgi:hypothetical protein